MKRIIITIILLAVIPVSYALTLNSALEVWVNGNIVNHALPNFTDGLNLATDVDPINVTTLIKVRAQEGSFRIAMGLNSEGIFYLIYLSSDDSGSVVDKLCKFKISVDSHMKVDFTVTTLPNSYVKCVLNADASTQEPEIDLYNNF